MSGLPRILILGAAGQVGTELRRSFDGSGEIVAVNREDVDLVAADKVRELVRRIRPDVILNAAAYTAVDQAETEPEPAMAVNAHAPRILAEVALLSNALLVHFSTDYVFDGAKQGAWTEEDSPAPLNFYGASKLAGEEAIQNVGGSYLIFRTSWVYGASGSNFLLTMLRLARERDRIAVVDDQVGAPTASFEVARATRQIVEGVTTGRFGAKEDWAGLYHMTCSGSTSWYGFARAIFARAGRLLDGKVPKVDPIASRAYPTRAIRPHNSVLSNAKLEAAFGVRLANWETALDAVIREMK